MSGPPPPPNDKQISNICLPKVIYNAILTLNAERRISHLVCDLTECNPAVVRYVIKRLVICLFKILSNCAPFHI